MNNIISDNPKNSTIKKTKYSTNKCGLVILFILGIINLLASTSSANDFAVDSNDFVLKNRDIVIKDDNNKVRVRIDSETGDIRVYNKKGKVSTFIQTNGSNISVGSKERAGDLLLLPRNAGGRQSTDASVHIDGSNARQRLGGSGTNGELALVNDKNKPRIHLSGKTGKLSLSSNNPIISLHDISGGNTDGWEIQATQAGKLKFNAGNDNESLLLSPNGKACFGLCKKGSSAGQKGQSLWLQSDGLNATNWINGTSDIAAHEKNSALYLNRKGGAVVMYKNKPENEQIKFTPGRLSIGASTGQMSKASLVVNGNIVAKEIVVRPDGWADDVFDSNYDMLSLKKLSQFIEINKHLPGIPSEESVTNNGLSLARFNAQLLRNVEELTLRFIQQADELKNLKASHKHNISEIQTEHNHRISKLELMLASLLSEGQQ